MKTKIKEFSRIIFSLSIIAFVIYAAVQEPGALRKNEEEVVQTAEAHEKKEEEVISHPMLPKGERIVLSSTTRRVSAYNLVPEQTDRTPHIGAAGVDLYKLSKKELFAQCANNAFGLKDVYFEIDVRGTVIEKLVPNGKVVCKNLDRMNRRFPNSVDISFGGGENKQLALKFGAPTLKVTAFKIVPDEGTPAP